MRDRRRLNGEQARIGRKNARRAFIGALRSVRSMLDAEFPAIAKPAVARDPIDVAADRMTWRQFEYGVIAHLRVEWDMELAQRFNAKCAAKFGVAPKAIVLDGTLVRYLGMHGDSIRLATGLSREEKWRTLMHEIAHYPPHRIMHGRQFVRELAGVYRMWREFRLEIRVAAKPLATAPPPPQTQEQR